MNKKISNGKDKNLFEFILNKEAEKKEIGIHLDILHREYSLLELKYKEIEQEIRLKLDSIINYGNEDQYKTTIVNRSNKSYIININAGHKTKYVDRSFNVNIREEEIINLETIF